MAKYRLHCIGASGNAYKIALYLACAGLDWAPVGVDFARVRDPAWRADNNAMGEVPVLEVDGQFMTQSAAVLTWLADTTGQFALDDPSQKYEALRWLLFDNHKFTSNYAMHRFQRTLTPEPVAPEIVAFLRGRLEASHGIVEKHLTKQPFIMGSRLTYVDFSFAGYMFYPQTETGIDISSAYPAIDAWRNRIAALPGWKPPYEMMPHGTKLPVRKV